MWTEKFSSFKLGKDMFVTDGPRSLKNGAEQHRSDFKFRFTQFVNKIASPEILRP